MYSCSCEQSNNNERRGSCRGRWEMYVLKSGFIVLEIKFKARFVANRALDLICKQANEKYVTTLKVWIVVRDKQLFAAKNEIVESYTATEEMKKK